MNINDAYLWLKSIEGVTNNNINQIESNNIDIKDLINFSDKEIYNLKNINTNIKENIVKYKSLTYLEEIKSNLEKKFIKYVSIYDESYPSNLKHIYDAPKILFYKGNLEVLKNNEVIEFDRIYYDLENNDEVILCYGENPYVSYLDFNKVTKLIIVLKNSKKIHIEYIMEE